MHYISKYSSPIGGITLGSDGKHLTGLWFDGQKYFGSTLPAEHTEKSLPVFEQTKDWLNRYFNGEIPDRLPPLSLHGSPFRLAVWDILKRIPYGEVITYGEIAKQISLKNGTAAMSAQAVGGAVGHNPISIIIPCHRVVGTNRSLTGYAGGITAKQALLTLEGIDVSKYSVPRKGTAL